MTPADRAIFSLGEDIDIIATCIAAHEIDASRLFRVRPHLKADAETYAWDFIFAWDSVTVKCSKGTKPKKVRPKSAQGLRIEVQYKASGRVDTLSSNTPCDPFCHMEIEITLVCGPQGSDGRGYHYSWHIDRHAYGAAASADEDVEAVETPEEQSPEEDEESQPDAIHPLYHLQPGGRGLHAQIDHLEDPYGRVLVLDAPRLPTPPLDPILLLDFAFSNFDGLAWQLLRQDAQYRDVVLRAQERYWRPYFAVFHQHFSGAEPDSKWHPATLYPSLLRHDYDP